MTMLNLRDVYPFYHSDLFVEVSQEVAEAITTAARRESNARRQMYRYKAQYSLDRGDGIEHEMWAPFHRKHPRPKTVRGPENPVKSMLSGPLALEILR